MARHKQTPPPLPPAAQNQAPLAPSPWKKSWAQLRGPDGQVMKGALMNSAKQPCLGWGGRSVSPASPRMGPLDPSSETSAPNDHEAPTHAVPIIEDGWGWGHFLNLLLPLSLCLSSEEAPWSSRKGQVVVTSPQDPVRGRAGAVRPSFTRRMGAPSVPGLRGDKCQKEAAKHRGEDPWRGDPHTCPEIVQSV